MILPTGTQARMEEVAEAGVRAMIALVDMPDRNGLHLTPMRVVSAFKEMTAGYKNDPEQILSTVFDAKSDQMIILKGIEFASLCEHHLLPFVGTVAIGYLPGKVVGISKLARLVGCFARRLQIQERLTAEIASAIEVHLEAQGVAVVVEAAHECMGCRGVKQSNARMVTSAMLGLMMTDKDARAEFLMLTR